MATGYEVDMYNNIKTVAEQSKKQTEALERIARSLSTLAEVASDGVLRVDPNYNQ